MRAEPDHDARQQRHDAQPIHECTRQCWVGSAGRRRSGAGAFPHNRTRTSRFCLMHRQVGPMTSKRIGSAPCRRSLSTLGKLNPAALAGFFCGTPFEWMMAMRPRRSFGRTGMPGRRGRSWRRVVGRTGKSRKALYAHSRQLNFRWPTSPLRRGFLYALLGRVTALSRAWCLRQSPYPLDSSLSKPIRVALALRRNCDDRLGKRFGTRTGPR